MNLTDTSWHDDLLAAALKGDADTIEDKLHEDPSHIHATFRLDGLSSPDNSDDEATLLDIALRFHHQEMALVVLGTGDAYTQLASSEAIDLDHLLNLPPLHTANLKDALSLVASGTDADVKDARGNTSLHIAAANNDTKTIKSFLKAEANINAQNARGRTPLHVAVQHGSLNAVRLLLEKGGSTETEDAEGHEPISLAFDREENIKHNFDVFDESALETCNEIIDALSEAGAKLSEAEAKRPYHLFLAAVENNDRARVEELLKGENIEYLSATYPSQMTPLQIAAQHGHDDIVRLLLEAGADVDAGGDEQDRDTPLLLALKASTIRILLDAGAVLPERFVDFYCAKDQFSLTDNTKAFNPSLLLEAGIPANQQDGFGETLLHAAVQDGQNASDIEALLAAGADVNARDNSNNTPFHVVYLCGDEVVQMLLQAGADTEARNDDNKTPLLASLERITDSGKGSITWETEFAECLAERLLAVGANFNVHDKDGNTPLHWISYMDEFDAELAERIIKQTTDVNAVNSKGETPLSIALAKENPGVAGLLLAAGAASGTGA